MNEQDVEHIVELLKQLEPGFQPYPVFEQLARLVALPILEIVPLRLNQQNQVEVLLLERDQDDKLWPHALHTPGTVIRATDLPIQSSGSWPALERILHDELKDTYVSSPQYIDNLLHESRRGVEQAQIYWVEVQGTPNIGTFYPVNDLPSNLIDSQRTFIAAAAEKYMAVQATQQ